jgi:hypothetical protein
MGLLSAGTSFVVGVATSRLLRTLTARKTTVFVQGGVAVVAKNGMGENRGRQDRSDPGHVSERWGSNELYLEEGALQRYRWRCRNSHDQRARFLSCIQLTGVASENADPDIKDALKRWIDDPTSLWTKPSGEHRTVLSHPDIQSRILDLADDQQPQLRARLREGGIEL